MPLRARSASVSTNGATCPAASAPASPATEAEFDSPSGVVVDDGGNVYVSDDGIRLLAPASLGPLAAIKTAIHEALGERGEGCHAGRGQHARRRGD